MVISTKMLVEIWSHDSHEIKNTNDSWLNSKYCSILILGIESTDDQADSRPRALPFSSNISEYII